MLERSHPIVDAVAAANAAVVEVVSVDPLYMRVSEQVEALLELAALESRVAELKARLVVTLDSVGAVVEESGARDLAFWFNQQTRMGIRKARAEISFARRLSAHPQTSAAMQAGVLSQAQADVIMAAVEALPEDLIPDLVGVLDETDECGRDVAARAEGQLVADALVFDPVRLRVLGSRILEVVAPEVADEVESRKLEAAERRARERVRLTLSPLGDGTTRISGRIPDLAAAQLSTMLDALLNPRRTPAWADKAPAPSEGEPIEAEASESAEGRAPPAGGESGGEPALPPWWSLPAPHKMGEAFCELLSRVPSADLPVHGTTATTLFVTVTLDQLRSGLGAAVVMGPGGEGSISAAEARRLACTSGLIPTVLGSKGEVLDLGRTARLFSAAQNKALMVRFPTCQGEGCDHPASHTEVHHHLAWVDGGRTDLCNAILLCSRCHHRAHDPAFTYELRADGVVVFTRL